MLAAGHTLMWRECRIRNWDGRNGFTWSIIHISFRSGPKAKGSSSLGHQLWWLFMNYCHFRSQCARYLQAHMTMASELQTIVRCNAVVTTGEREAPSDSRCPPCPCQQRGRRLLGCEVLWLLPCLITHYKCYRLRVTAIRHHGLPRPHSTPRLLQGRFFGSAHFCHDRSFTLHRIISNQTIHAKDERWM